MNNIKALLDKSDYGYGDFLNYRIDDYWFDEKLEELYPGNAYKGLVPTLDCSMMSADEKGVVWNRILPNENETTICPILMCPDDNDFSCALIVAEITTCSDVIQWKRIGVDNTKEWEAEKVGTIVQWFEEIPEISFDKYQYLAMLHVFKEQMEADKK